eukprot:2551519-Pyramimonas_sp.AAC.1
MNEDKKNKKQKRTNNTTNEKQNTTDCNNTDNKHSFPHDPHGIEVLRTKQRPPQTTNEDTTKTNEDTNEY